MSVADATIDRLNIEINTKAKQGSDGLQSLIDSIGELLGVTNDAASDLDEMSESMSAFTKALSGFKSLSGSIRSVAKSLQEFNGLPDMSNLSIGINRFAESTKGLASIGEGLQGVKDFGKSITSLTKSIPKLQALDLSEVSEKISQLVVALRPLTDEMIRAGSGMSNFGEQMRHLAQAARTANSTSNSLRRTGQSYSEFRQNVSRGLSLISLNQFVELAQKGISALRGFVDNINNYIEDVNLFQVAMGDAAQSGAEFAQTMQYALGIDAGDAMRNMGVFNNMTTSFGVANKQAELMSKNMTQLIYDWSSFYNLGIDRTAEIMSSSIAGMTQPARQLGIDISQTRLQQELWNLGINETVSNLNQADKSILRYIALMKQSTNAQGDMARTLITPSNALRILEAQLRIAGRAIGSVFIPAFMAILPPVIAAVKVIGQFAQSLAALVGFKMPTIDYSDVGSALGAVDDLDDGIEEIGNTASKTQKKLNNLIGGFDELNILQSQTSSSGAGAGGLGSILGDIQLPEYDMFGKGISDEIDKWIPKMKELLKWALAIGAAFLAWKAIEGLVNLYDWFTKLTPLAQTLLTKLAGLALAIAGVVIYVNAFNDAWKNGVDWGNLIGMVAGATLAMIGLSMVFNPLVGGIAGVAGGIGILVVSIRDLIKNGPKMKNIIGIIAGLGVSALGVMTSLGKFKNVGKGFTNIIDGFKIGFIGFKDALVSTGNPLRALGAGMRDTRQWFDQNATSAQKAAIGIAGFAVAAGTTYVAVKGLAESIFDGSASFGDFAKAGAILIPVLTAVGVAMYAALGPVGLVIAGVGALVGAVVAVTQAFESNQKQIALSTLFSENGGIPVRQIGDEFVALANKVIESNQAIIDNGNRMKDLGSSIQGSSEMLHGFQVAMGTSAEAAQEYLPLISQEFETMTSEIQQRLNLARDTLLLTFSGTPQQILNELGTTLDEVVGITVEAHGGASKELAAWVEEYKGLSSAIEQGTATAEQKNRFNELLTLMQDTWGGANNATQEYIEQINNIPVVDFSELYVEGNIDATTANVQAELERIGEAGADAQKSIEEVYRTNLNALEDMKNYMSSDDYNLQKQIIDRTFALDSAQLAEAQASAMTRIKDSFQAGLDEVASNIDFAWYEHVIGDVKNNEAKAATDLKNSFSTVLTTAQENIDAVSRGVELGSDFTQGYANGISSGDLKAIATNSMSLADAAIKALQREQQSASPSKVTTSMGKDFTDGYTNGIKDNSNSAVSATQTMVQNTIKTMQDSFTPAKMNPIGKTVVQGITNGITANKTLVVTATNTVANDINQQFKTELALAKTQPYGKNAVSGIQQGLNSNRSLVIDAAKTLSTGTIQQFQQYLSQNATRQYGANAGNGIADGIRSAQSNAANAMNQVGNALKNALSQIISDLQRQASNADITIRVNTTVSGSSSPVGKYPRFASGGVVTRPTVGLIGEYAGASSNPEIVSPQNIMYETIQEANGEGFVGVMSLLQELIQAVREGKEVHLNVGGREITEVVNEENQKLSKVTGR